MKTTIGDFLISRLAQLGISDIIGVPGDFNLQFLDQIKHTPDINFVGCCNELNSAYAADGYGRLNGISAMLTTYGVGDLSTICGVAGAAAEHVPMVCISGAPPLHAMRKHLPLHHTLGEGSYDDVLNCFVQFCSECARLTPDNAAIEIDRILTACYQNKRPVYIQLPSDISHIVIEVENAPLPLDQGSSRERLDTALADVLSLWRDASRPAILVDMDAERFGYDGQLLELAEMTGTPYAALATGKAILPELHPLFLGTYMGAATPDTCRERIENADFLLTTSPRFIEGNSGHFTVSLPEQSVVALSHDAVTLKDKIYYGVKPRNLMARLLEALQEETGAEHQQYPPEPRPAAAPVADRAPLTQARLWPRLARFIEPNDVVIAEAGTSTIGLSAQLLPAGVTYMSSDIWGAIGFTLPALLGSCLAAPDRRHLLFIGDGSFQLTAQELSTLLLHGQKPIIFLLNNRGYTIERYIHGLEEPYNKVQNWNYGALASVFDDADRHVSLSVKDETQLEQALQTASASDKLVFVELHLDPLDAPQALKKFGPLTAEFDYGPLGPHRHSGSGP